jgi:hypothetical protein
VRSLNALQASGVFVGDRPKFGHATQGRGVFTGERKARVRDRDGGGALLLPVNSTTTAAFCRDRPPGLKGIVHARFELLLPRSACPREHLSATDVDAQVKKHLELVVGLVTEVRPADFAVGKGGLREGDLPRAAQEKRGGLCGQVDDGKERKLKTLGGGGWG